MKYAPIIAGILLGGLFVMSAVVVLFSLVQAPPPPEGTAAAMFFGAFGPTGYLTFVKVLELLGGVLVAIPKTRNLGLLVLEPDHREHPRLSRVRHERRRAVQPDADRDRRARALPPVGGTACVCRLGYAVARPREIFTSPQIEHRMRTNTIPRLAAALLFAGTLLAAEPPAMPKPVAEHDWLKQFAGEWETETEIFMEPGKPPMKARGTESARMLGGFWVMGEHKGEFMGTPFTGVMTVGFDPGKKKYVGTWVDSNTSALWQYVGTVDASGKVLTLETEGFCPMEQQVCQFKDVIEFKSSDHRVLTSTKLGKDGKWTPVMTLNAHRKK